LAHLRILPEDRGLDIDETESILHASLRAGIPHVHACGGNARCSTCRVFIVSGKEACLPRGEKEARLVEKLHFGPEIRLACQTKIVGDVTCRRLVLDEQDTKLAHSDVADGVPGAVGEERRLALLFADIRGFTKMAESLPPYDIVHILNRYFIQMGKVISQNAGVINNYMGDGLMALFGLKGDKDAARCAVQAALEMLVAVEELQVYFQSAYRMGLAIGIGVHVGDVVIGRVGAEDSKKLTAIGDAVNFASRIEAANKDAGTSLLISEATHAAVQASVCTGKIVTVSVKGKTGEHRLFEVVGAKRNLSAP